MSIVGVGFFESHSITLLGVNLVLIVKIHKIDAL